MSPQAATPNLGNSAVMVQARKACYILRTNVACCMLFEHEGVSVCRVRHDHDLEVWLCLAGQGCCLAFVDAHLQVTSAFVGLSGYAHLTSTCALESKLTSQHPKLTFLLITSFLSSPGLRG